MNRSQRFEMRLDPEEGRRLRLLAARADRTPSDLLRAIVRRLDLTSVTTGIPLSEAETTERELSVA